MKESISKELLLDIQEYLRQNYQIDTDGFIGEVESANYNPENDFPIPTFLRKELLEAHNNDSAPFEDEYEICASKIPVPAEMPPHKKREEIILPPALFADHLGEIRGILDYKDESFSEMLLRKIDEKGMTDSDCYHKAQMSRSHFNKIKNSPDYNVQKSSVLALACALELSVDDTDEFLTKAGYAFSSANKSDLIVKYCIEHKIYDLMKVNEILFAFDQALLGSGVRE